MGSVAPTFEQRRCSSLWEVLALRKKEPLPLVGEWRARTGDGYRGVLLRELVVVPKYKVNFFSAARVHGTHGFEAGLIPQDTTELNATLYFMPRNSDEASVKSDVRLSWRDPGGTVVQSRDFVVGPAL